MSAREIFIICIVTAVGLLLFSFVRDKKTFITRAFLRAVAGVFVIYIVNAFFSSVKIPLNLGVNIYSICTTAFLGVPGLALLYGILGCRFL